MQYGTRCAVAEELIEHEVLASQFSGFVTILRAVIREMI